MVGKIEEIITAIVETLTDSGIDLSDIQLLPDSVPYIRSFVPSSSADVNTFYPATKLGKVTKEEIEEFIFSHLDNTQAQILTRDKQISFRLELNDSNISSSSISAFRATAYYQRDRLSVALRALKTKIPTPDQLHLHPIIVSDYMQYSSGLIILSGPAGSGKTTSAVSLLKNKLVSHKGKGVLHLVTVESPIEYEIVVNPDEGIVEQREVGIDTPDYKTATRDIVRVNPNIIFVGEVRDAETAINCLQMASTGHLVLTTFHADSVQETIARFRSFLRTSEDVSLFATSLVAVVNQKLFSFKTLSGLTVFPVIEAVKENENIIALIVSDRLEEIKNYMIREQGCITHQLSIEYINKVINSEEERELIRKPPNPPVSTDF